MLKKEQIEIINQRFDDSLIKSRRGNYGMELIYVGTPDYIRRLNQVFGHEWDWTIVNTILEGDHIIVHGALVCDGVRKEAFGGAQVKRKKSSNEAVDLADDYKAAASDALKKACSLFGIGLHLWTDDEYEAPSEPSKTVAVSKTITPEDTYSRQKDMCNRVIDSFATLNIAREDLELAIGKVDISWNEDDFQWLRNEYMRIKKVKDPNKSMLRTRGDK